MLTTALLSFLSPLITSLTSIFAVGASLSIPFITSGISVLLPAKSIAVRVVSTFLFTVISKTLSSSELLTSTSLLLLTSFKSESILSVR